MKEKISNLNKSLKGIRGILLNWFLAGVTIFLEAFFAALTGLNKEAVKVACTIAALNTAKLLYTDTWPRIKAWLETRYE